MAYRFIRKRAQNKIARTFPSKAPKYTVRVAEKKSEEPAVAVVEAPADPVVVVEDVAASAEVAQDVETKKKSTRRSKKKAEEAQD